MSVKSSLVCAAGKTPMNGEDFFMKVKETLSCSGTGLGKNDM